MLTKLKAWAKPIKRDVLALYLAARDAATPWPIKVLALCIAGYALSRSTSSRTSSPFSAFSTKRSWLRSLARLFCCEAISSSIPTVIAKLTTIPPTIKNAALRANQSLKNVVLGI